VPGYTASYCAICAEDALLQHLDKGRVESSRNLRRVILPVCLRAAPRNSVVPCNDSESTDRDARTCGLFR